MKPAVFAATLLVLLLASPADAQGINAYLEDTADAAVRVQIITPPGVEAKLGFWRQLLSSIGIRQTIRAKPPVGTKLLVQSSAYASSPYQTDSTPCVTAAGTRVRPGVVASNFLPIGTLLEINGEEYIVEDRMNPRYQGYFLDIWFPATSKALEFGRRKLEVKIVGYGKPGQPIREEEQAATVGDKKQAEEDASVWAALKDQFAYIGSLLSARENNVDRFDIDCLTGDTT